MMLHFTDGELRRVDQKKSTKAVKHAGTLHTVERTAGGFGVVIERTYRDDGCSERPVAFFATEQEAEMVLRFGRRTKKAG